MINHVAAHPILAATAVSKITTPEQLLNHLLTAANSNERRYLLTQFAPTFPPAQQNQLAELGKKEADRLMWENIDLCFEFANLIAQMAQLFDAPMFQALSLRACGNGYAIGLREHQKGSTATTKPPPSTPPWAAPSSKPGHKTASCTPWPTSAGTMKR
ncbi:MAG: hypothetical protein R3D55_25185 [Chloroflexota bacterium]